jgi:hypothetical protein
VNSPVVAEPHPTLARGEQVTLCAGPLSGLTGTLVEIRSSLRLVVSVQLLQRSVLVEIERGWVVPSGRSQPVCSPASMRRESAFLPSIETQIKRKMLTNAVPGG